MLWLTQPSLFLLQHYSAKEVENSYLLLGMLQSYLVDSLLLIVANEMVGRNVLIVDDSSTARNQIKGTLSQLGLNIIECCDGLEALTLLKGTATNGRGL